MVDQRARDIYATGLGVAKVFEGIKSEQRRTEMESATNEYAEAIASGKNPEDLPQYKGNINGAALAKAYAMQHQKQLGEESVRKARLDNNMAEAKMANFKLGEKIQQIDALKGTGQEAKAKALQAEAYNKYLINGDNIGYDAMSQKFYRYDIGDDGVLLRGDEVDDKAIEEGMGRVRQMIASGEFKDLWVGLKQQEDAVNSAALMEAEEMVDPATGKFVGRRAKFMKNGQPDWQMSYSGQEGTVPWSKMIAKADPSLPITRAEWERRQSNKLGIDVKKADINYKNAAAAANKRKGIKNERQGWSTERKLASDLAETVKGFKGDVDKAMQYVMKAANAKNAMAANKLADDLLMDDKEKAAYFKAVIANIPTGPEKQKRREIFKSILRPTSGLPSVDVVSSAKVTNGIGKPKPKSEKPGGTAKDFYQSLVRGGMSKEEARKKTMSKFKK